MTQTRLAKLLGVKPTQIQNRCFSSNRETRIVFRAILALTDSMVEAEILNQIKKDDIRQSQQATNN